MAESEEEIIAAVREVIDEVLGRELRDLRASIDSLVQEMRRRRQAGQRDDADPEKSKEQEH